MDWSELTLSTARGLSLAAVLSGFGACLFRQIVLPGALAREGEVVARDLGRSLDRLIMASLGLAVGLGVVWLWLQTETIAGVAGWSDIWAALPTVALHTQFGHIVLTRLALLVVALGVSRGWPWLTTILSAAAVLLQAGLGHAAAMEGAQGAGLMASEALHLLAAGAWLGGLAPLAIVLRRVSPTGAGAASHGFTPLGLACVALLAGTGLLQAWELIGGLGGLAGTPYGLMALAKLALFAVLLGLATVNRFVFTDRLKSARPARAMLIGSVAVETGLGLMVVLAAGRLASLAPSIHEQPTWPFAVRPSLDAFSDPGLVGEVEWALAELGAGVALAGVALFWRRVRWPGLAVAAGLAVLAIPRLDLLFVEAYPSSFYVSPTEFGDSGILHGAHLFGANCAACHGAQGHGDGPAAKGLRVPPADLTAEHFWAHSDGDLFWYVSHGIDDPPGVAAMPGFAGTLSSDARWDVLDYVRARNSGESMATTGTWPHPVPVPQFDAVCANGRHIDLDDLRGRDMLIVDGPPPDPAALGMAVIELDRTATARPGVCVASGMEAGQVFALLLGVDVERLEGAQILGDRDGWLRTRALPGVAGGWIGDNVALARAVADIDAHPVQAPIGHHHH